MARGVRFLLGSRQYPFLKKNGPGIPVFGYCPISYVCAIFVFFLFSNISLCTSTFRQNAKEVDMGRPSGHIRRGVGVIRAVCRARQALEVFFVPSGSG